MEKEFEKSLKTALDIYSILITGKDISAQDKDTSELYNAFYSDSEVYEIVESLLKRLNLHIYEYNESLFITAGNGNKVFGYTNDDLKKQLGLRLNKELYLVYLIMYETLLSFYKTSDTYQIKDYIREDELIESVTKELRGIYKSGDIYSPDETDETSFKEIAILWDSLPPVISEDRERNRASRGSKTGYVKLTANFMKEEKLITVVDDRLYPTDRFHAIAQNYFEDDSSAIRKYLQKFTQDGGEGLA